MVLKHMLHFLARTHLEAEEIAGHSNQRCRRFCFVIIIPYPDRKANICSIRLRAEKGEVQDVLHRECRYSLIKNDKNDYVRTKKQNLRNKKENVYDLL